MKKKQKNMSQQYQKVCFSALKNALMFIWFDVCTSFIKEPVMVDLSWTEELLYIRKGSLNPVLRPTL